MMNSIKNFLLRLAVKFQMLFTHNGAWKTAKKTMLFRWFTRPNKVKNKTFKTSSAFIVSCTHDFISSIHEFIEENPDRKTVSIALGDSIQGLARGKLRNVIDLNFAIPGTGALDFATVFEYMKPFLEHNGLKIDTIYVGTWAGNPFLHFHSYESAIKDTKDAWDRIRELEPYARIVTFGLPPTLTIYANSQRYRFLGFLVSRAMNDGNAIVVTWDGFGDLLPEAVLQPDGIHLSDYGFALLESKFKQAKEIDYMDINKEVVI